MAAQRDAGLVNRGTAGTGNANVTGGLRSNPPEQAPPTLAEVGIDKNLADRARKLEVLQCDLDKTADGCRAGKSLILGPCFHLGSKFLGKPDADHRITASCWAPCFRFDRY